MNYSLEILKMIFYLIIILVAIYLLARFLKKFYLNPGGGENLELIEQIYLESKKSLKLVRVKDKILLLSVSEEKIEKLKEWPEAEFDYNRNSKLENKFDFKNMDFNNILNKFMNRKEDDKKEDNKKDRMNRDDNDE
ncbi:MAG: FliO/MopB family protein [Bacillota bacterium]